MSISPAEFAQTAHIAVGDPNDPDIAFTLPVPGPFMLSGFKSIDPGRNQLEINGMLYDCLQAPEPFSREQVLLKITGNFTGNFPKGTPEYSNENSNMILVVDQESGLVRSAYADASDFNGDFPLFMFEQFDNVFGYNRKEKRWYSRGTTMFRRLVNGSPSIFSPTDNYNPVLYPSLSISLDVNELGIPSYLVTTICDHRILKKGTNFTRKVTRRGVISPTILTDYNPEDVSNDLGLEAGRFSQLAKLRRDSNERIYNAAGKNFRTIIGWHLLLEGASRTISKGALLDAWEVHNRLYNAMIHAISVPFETSPKR